jgi:hypothetical protein
LPVEAVLGDDVFFAVRFEPKFRKAGDGYRMSVAVEIPAVGDFGQTDIQRADKGDWYEASKAQKDLGSAQKLATHALAVDRPLPLTRNSEQQKFADRIDHAASANGPPLTRATAAAVKELLTPLPRELSDSERITAQARRTLLEKRLRLVKDFCSALLAKNAKLAEFTMTLQDDPG